jgi:hypothetical protein
LCYLFRIPSFNNTSLEKNNNKNSNSIPLRLAPLSRIAEEEERWEGEGGRNAGNEWPEEKKEIEGDIRRGKNTQRLSFLLLSSVAQLRRVEVLLLRILNQDTLVCPNNSNKTHSAASSTKRRQCLKLFCLFPSPLVEAPCVMLPCVEW